MDAVPVTAAPDAARYMVFKYCVNRPTVAAMEPESVTDFLSMEATVNDEVPVRRIDHRPRAHCRRARSFFWKCVPVTCNRKTKASCTI